MHPRHRIGLVLLLAGLTLPAMASAYGLSVEVWTDRGRDAVYQPGQTLEVRTRTSRDAHLLVYEIDTEGYVRVLYPEAGRSGFVEGRRTHRLPGADADFEWVAQGPVGQGYIVAIASVSPLNDLPWYLRPVNRQAEEVGYYDVNEEEAEDEGITADGRIVGDPFVAMERIRRRVVREHDDDDMFATAYTSYYVHHEVRYPRYLCYDCHRPNHWSWWSGFDPYYSSCSVFDVHVNWRWAWGPTYWFGHTPYFVFTYRPNCPPYYHRWRGSWYSSWHGWRHWRSLWGPRLTRRYKSPPPGYRGPDPRDVADRGRDRGRGDRRIPPGFIPPPGADEPALAVGRARRSDGGDRIVRRSVVRGRNVTTDPVRRSIDRPGRSEPRLLDSRSLRDRTPARETPVRVAPRRATTTKRPAVGRSFDASKRSSRKSAIRKDAPRARKSARPAPSVEPTPRRSTKAVKSSRGNGKGREAPAPRAKSRGGGKRK